MEPGSRPTYNASERRELLDGQIKGCRRQPGMAQRGTIHFPWPTERPATKHCIAKAFIGLIFPGLSEVGNLGSESISQGLLLSQKHVPSLELSYEPLRQIRQIHVPPLHASRKRTTAGCRRKAEKGPAQHHSSWCVKCCPLARKTAHKVIRTSACFQD